MSVFDPFLPLGLAHDPELGLGFRLSSNLFITICHVSMGGCGAKIRRMLATQALILRTHSEILGVVLLRHKAPQRPLAILFSIAQRSLTSD